MLRSLMILLLPIAAVDAPITQPPVVMVGAGADCGHHVPVDIPLHGSGYSCYGALDAGYGCWSALPCGYASWDRLVPTCPCPVPSFPVPVSSPSAGP